MPQNNSDTEKSSGSDAELQRREYRDEEGNVHHHTHRYMEQHGEQHGGRGEGRGQGGSDRDQRRRTESRQAGSEDRRGGREGERDQGGRGRNRRGDREARRREHGERRRSGSDQGGWSNRTILLLAFGGVAALGLASRYRDQLWPMPSPRAQRQPRGKQSEPRLIEPQEKREKVEKGDRTGVAP